MVRKRAFWSMMEVDFTKFMSQTFWQRSVVAGIRLVVGRRACRVLLLMLLTGMVIRVQSQPLTPLATAVTILRPAAVFDGQDLYPGWVVLVEGDKITAVGPPNKVAQPAGVRTYDLPGLTLLPGLIEGHSHLLLHPYNETAWNY